MVIFQIMIRGTSRTLHQVGIYSRTYRIHTLKSEPTIKRRLFPPILHSAVTGQAVRASSRVGTRADVCTCERDKYIARDPTLLSFSLRTYVCNMKVQRVQYPGQKLLTELETYTSLLHPVCYSYPQGNILYSDSSPAKSERRSGRGMYANEERTLGKMEERKERRKREK